MEKKIAHNGCIGCTACYSACPQEAISMETDKYGFYMPTVDEGKCIHCDKCGKVCPLSNRKILRKLDDNLLSQYMFAKNMESRVKSCSGGVFYSLAEKIIQNGGIVCGCVWNSDFLAHHICTSDIEIVKKMRGSKYVQSRLENCFIQIKQYLSEGKTVLFGGTGCQTTALINYLGDIANYKNLITCAVICGGVPSSLVWKKYKEQIEKNYNSKISSLEMRNKKNGWLMPEIEVIFENGKVIREVLYQENLYGTNFVTGLFINKECMECKFKLDSVDADIIIGDDWGIDKARLKKSRNKGSSAVIALTKQGEESLHDIEKFMIIEKGNIKDIINSHHVLTKNHEGNNDREEFFKRILNDNILDLLQENYDKWSNKVHMKQWTKSLYKLKIYTPIYNFLWKFSHK